MFDIRSKKVRFLIGIVTVVSLVTATALCIGGPKSTTTQQSTPSKRQLTIATAGTAGSLYPMGVAMAETINKHTDFIASAQASAASVENLRLLHEGDVDWAISQAEIAYFAYNGFEDYKGNSYPELRALFGTVVSYVQIFVRKDAGIESVKDLKDKRLGVDRPGSGGERAAQRILGYYGLTYEDMKSVSYGGASELVQLLMDGKIDAFIVTHPLRSAPLIELTTRNKGKIDLVSIEDDDFYKAFPYFEKTKVSAGTYEGIEHDTYVPTSRVIMLTTNKMSEGDVYTLLKAIWEHRDEWEEVNVAVKTWVTLDKALWGIPIPLHPGAVKFYKEKGFEIPENLLPPELKK